MLDSIIKIESYIELYTFDSFLNDSKTQSAVLMQLHIIGELAKKIPEEIRTQIDLPWKQICGLRDMISHDYFSLDLKLVWNILEVRIVVMKEKIAAYAYGSDSDLV